MMALKDLTCYDTLHFNVTFVLHDKLVNHDLLQN